MARRSKYTPETVAKLKEAIGKGATYDLACDFAGIAESTFYEWLQSKPEFSEQLKAAEGAAAVEWLGQIDEAAKAGTWQAAAWKLERRYPQKYGRQVTELQGKDGETFVQRVIILDHDAGPPPGMAAAGGGKLAVSGATD